MNDISVDINTQIGILTEFIQKVLIEQNQNILLIDEDGSLTDKFPNIEIKRCCIFCPRPCLGPEHKDFYLQILNEITEKFDENTEIQKLFEKTQNLQMTYIEHNGHHIFKNLVQANGDLIIIFRDFSQYSQYIEDRDYHCLLNNQEYNPRIHFVFISKIKPELSMNGNKLLNSCRKFNVRTFIQHFYINSQNTFYISYCHKDKQLKDGLVQELTLRGFKCKTDDALEYMDNLEKFMIEIGNSQRTIFIISDSYLQSPNCMFELTQFFSHGEVNKRFFPIIIKNPINDIFSAESQIDYYKFWREKAESIGLERMNFGTDKELNKLCDDEKKYKSYISTAEKLFSMCKKNIIETFDANYKENEIIKFVDILETKSSELDNNKTSTVISTYIDNNMIVSPVPLDSKPQ